MSTDLRARSKELFNALDFDRPINFGLDELLKKERALPTERYVENLHGGDGDAVEELATQIDFSASAGAYLFTGNRGTGKTTELMRLAASLKQLGCVVFYVDMSDYLVLTQRVEISDFLISVMGAFSEKVSERYDAEVGVAGFFDRVWNFLRSEVEFEEVAFPAGPMELKAALVQTPLFKEELQRRTRGYVQQLVQQARDFALEAVNSVRAKQTDHDAKVVLIVDSVERLRGVGDTKDVREVFKSAETLFGSHADALRFTGLNVVYTIPPYLQALAGWLGAYYAGGRIYALPSVHVYERRPGPGLPPVASDEGLGKFEAIVQRRYPNYGAFLSREQLLRLAASSGGDLRDFFRMLRLAVARVPSLGSLPLTDHVLEDAENAVRGDMLPIAADDRAWLSSIAHSHSHELPSLDKLADFARLQQGKYVLQYRNGEDWYDVHPLLKQELQRGVTAGSS